MKTHGDSGDSRRQRPGHRRGEQQDVDRRRGDGAQHQSSELLDILVVGARQQIEEGVEAAIERAAQLRDGAVEGVQRQAGRRAVGQLQRRFLDAFQACLRDERTP
jgi:hypothetical protein